MDRISSDGLGSSQNSTSTLMSDASSATFKDKEPYKPEFLKFLESKFLKPFFIQTSLHNRSIYILHLCDYGFSVDFCKVTTE